jgi:hypothetical protein
MSPCPLPSQHGQTYLPASLPSSTSTFFWRLVFNDRLYSTRRKPVFFLYVATSTVHCTGYIRKCHVFPLIRFFSMLPPWGGGGWAAVALRNFGESAVLQLRAPVFMPVVRPWHIFCTLECALTCSA